MITTRIVKEKNKGWDELKKYFKELSENCVEVGFFNDQGIYPSEKNTRGWTYAQLAAYHELQADRNLVPLRPIFGSITKTQNKNFFRFAGHQLREQLRGTYRLKMRGNNHPNELYNTLGKEYGAIVRSRFGKRTLPRNALSTIKRKGSRLPMIETGHLRDSVSYRTSKQLRSRIA